jgi:hypothetical protein
VRKGNEHIRAMLRYKMSERLYAHGEHAPTLERSAAQRRTLEALATEGAQIMPNTSATWPVKAGPHILIMVRWVTIDALVRGGLIAPADWPGAYCFTDVGRVALAEDMKDNEMV